MTWQQRERDLRASWSTATSDDDRLSELTNLLSDMNSDATIGEGRSLAEDAFNLALSGEVSAENAEEAFLCLGDCYDALALEHAKLVAASRWRERFGADPPQPIFGFHLGNDGSVKEVFHSQEQVEKKKQ